MTNKKLKKPKEYRAACVSDVGYTDIPRVAIFVIDENTARDIVRHAAHVKTNGLYQVEMYDYRVAYLVHDPKEDTKEAESAGEENKVSTEACTMHVGKEDFWFSAYLKNSNEEIRTEYQPIKKLADYFGIPMAVKEKLEKLRGYFGLEGTTIDVEFEVPVGASAAERDAAFMAALAQKADVDYKSLGFVK